MNDAKFYIDKRRFQESLTRGTGGVAILSAKRMVLMPFAQISTRIGGACTVTIVIFLLRWLQT